MGVDEHIKALPSSGIGNLLPKKICTTALAFATVIAVRAQRLRSRSRIRLT